MLSGLSRRHIILRTQCRCSWVHSVQSARQSAQVTAISRDLTDMCMHSQLEIVNCLAVSEQVGGSLRTAFASLRHVPAADSVLQLHIEKQVVQLKRLASDRANVTV